MRAVVFLSLVLVWPAGLVGQQRGSGRYGLTGNEVAIYNVAGRVVIEPAQGQGEVSVQVTRGGTDAQRLSVEQGEVRGRETLRVIYPEDRIVYRGLQHGSSTTLQMRDDGTFGGDHYDGRREESARRRVKVSGSGPGLEAHADLRIQVPAGRDVAMYLAVGEISVSNVDGTLRVDAHSAPVTATGTRGSLTVDVGSGSVQVTQAQGDLSVDTGSGPVEVSKFKGDALSVDTGSGEVTGSEIQAAEISIDTGSGDIRLTAVSAPVLAFDTGSGGVTADLRSELRSLEVDTGSGDVDIKAPASLAAEVELETASGGVETDFPLQVTRHSRDHLVGRIGDGRGRVAIETGSGEVRLFKNSR